MSLLIAYLVLLVGFFVFMSYVILIYFADLLLVNGRCYHKLHPIVDKEFIGINNQTLLKDPIILKYIDPIVFGFTAVV